MTPQYDDLLYQLCQMDIVDTHEHLSPFEPPKDTALLPKRMVVTGVESGQEVIDEGTNVLDHLVLGGYLHNQVFASGLPFADPGISQPLPVRWRAFEPIWQQIRYTGYAQVVHIAIKDLLGYDHIDEKNIEEINHAYCQSLQPGYWQQIIKDKARIRISLLDSDLHCDRRFFRSLYRMDWLIMPVLQTHMPLALSFTKTQVRRFDDWLDAAEQALERAVELGAVGIKCGLAYKRPLFFDRVNYHEAESSFNQMYKMIYTPGWEPQRHIPNRAFEDFMMHYICRLVERKGLPMQVHTGIMVGGAGNYIDHANPRHLSNLFIEYPNLKFDIFHMGYPYQMELGVLAEQSKDVYVDLCWAHMISPKASQDALAEWLEFLPLNKILGFGGDLGGGNAHGVYAHAKLARMNIARVLDRKINEGILNRQEALRIAQQILFDNPARLFGLEDI